MKEYEAPKQALMNKQERTAAFQHPFNTTKNETYRKWSTTNFLAPAKKEKKSMGKEVWGQGKAWPDRKWQIQHFSFTGYYLAPHSKQELQCKQTGTNKAMQLTLTQCLPTCQYILVTILVSAHCNSFMLRRQKGKQEPTPLPQQQCGNQLAGALALRRPVEKQVLL